MPKPQWLKDKEAQAHRAVYEPALCCDCVHYGKMFKWTRHRGDERVTGHECDLHSGCLNTKYSIGCEDFAGEQLV